VCGNERRHLSTHTIFRVDGGTPLNHRPSGGLLATLNFDYPSILDLFPEYRAPKRSESASFLMWYLEKYYRLDPAEAVDYVCDQSGDKGIDGIFVNENAETIVIFQSRISQKNTTVGDVALKEFAGTLSQLR